MMRSTSGLFALCLIFLLAISACRGDETGETTGDGDDVGQDVQEQDAPDDDVSQNGEEDHPFADIEEQKSWALPGLSAPVHVIRTEGNIPHIYAENELDAARVHGFIAAQDRFFMMDLTRRMGLGELTPLLGDAGLDTDIESRMTGTRYVAQRMVDSASDEVLAIMEAYAEGINFYIEQAKAGEAAYPEEVNLAWQLLELDGPGEMLSPFGALDVAGMFTTFMYQSGFETGDIRRDTAYHEMDTLYEGDLYQNLRRQGVKEDIWGDPRPVKKIAAGDWGPPANLPTGFVKRFAGEGSKPKLEAGLLERISESLAEHHERRAMRSQEKGFGSNAWAVAGTHTPDGASLMAADGHLPLGIPSILYNVGVDTQVLGSGEGERTLGMVIPGIPFIALGTNGHVAWAFTQLSGDITDWYAETIRLDDEGNPVESFFDGEWHPLVGVDETYEIAGVTLLESEERVETWRRYQTFDGKWLLDIEGERVSSRDLADTTETVVRTHSGWIIPRDMNGDGEISAVSFAYTGLHMDDLLGAFRNLGKSEDVLEFREATRGMIATSFNFVASDSAGDIYYSAYQGTPCRGYLPRDEEGEWVQGAHPALLLDGSRYKAFEIPTKDGVVDESFQDDPYRCVIPFDEIPQRFSPESGYVLTANNDPVGVSFEGSLASGPWYIGGAWDVGFRADTIDRYLAKYIAEERATIETMAELQANVESPLGALFVEPLLEAIALGESYVQSTPIVFEDWQQRLFNDYQARRDELQEVAQRLSAWRDGGYKALSGVETFYHQPAAGEQADAVATMIFNAYISRFLSMVFGDEPIPGVWQASGTAARVRLLHRMLEGRGPGNSEGLASYFEDTQESIFFDIRNTPELERSRELMIRAMVAALDYLKSEPTDSRRSEGGFGTDDMDQWLWGLRHQVEFESLLASYLDDQPSLGALMGKFSITTNRLPLATDMGRHDPRGRLEWFPRPGDQYNVDAANPGMSGTDFRHSSGPVMRMVVSLKDGEVKGQNIIPGGQSGDPDSPFFDDQAALWLGNQTYPMRFHLEDVLEGAIGREVFSPR